MRINKKNENKTITLPESVELDMGDRTVILEKGDRIKVVERATRVPAPENELYIEVVHQTDSQLPDDFFNRATTEMAEYLSQWDYGDYDGEVYDYDELKRAVGRGADISWVRVEGAGNYAIAVDARMGDASLYAFFDEDDDLFRSM